MRILIVAATELEIAPLAEQLRLHSSTGRHKTAAYRDHVLDILPTGVGMVATAARTAHALSVQHYDVAFNFGVCGSFDRDLRRAQVVHVVSDRLSELGAEDGDRFLTVHDLKLLADDEFPFSAGALINTAPPANAVLSGLPRVSAITVNTVHGNDASIAEVCRRLNPQTESMEGAAFMYACLIAGVRFAQVRAVSNVVERRNRADWDLAGAIENLSVTATAILDSL